MKKEIIHILRDWRSLLVIILMPILMIILYGYAITLDMKNIKFAVIDESNTPESRMLVDHFLHNKFFVRSVDHISREEIEHAFKNRSVQLVIVIAKDFLQAGNAQRNNAVQLIIDASDSNVGTFINNYSNRVLRIFNEELNPSMPVLFQVEQRILYNPDMKSAFFFVPALVAIILLLISALLTSITITREKETGTMEQILLSPVHPLEILLGKVIPYIAIGLLNGAMILLFAYLLFSVPVRGSLLLVGALSLVYIFTALSFGLMISTIAKTQQIAMLMTLMTTVLPSMLLSGFVFPIASMPLALQYISKLIPASYFLIIIRGIMLKGIGLFELWEQAAMLGGIGVIMILISVKRFKMNLEG